MSNWKRTFAIIWTGQFISLLTSSIVGYAIIFSLSIETKSAEVLAFAVLSAHLPQVVLGLFVGVYIDRWNKKRIMIISDLFIASCTLALCALFLSGNRELEYFYLLGACRSIGTTFHTPALQASIPLLAPESELPRIAGINQSIQSTCSIIAPMIGATLIGFLRIEYILLLDVVGALIACTSLLFVPIIYSKRKSMENNIRKGIKECFIAIGSKIGLPYLFIGFTVVTFAVMPIAVLVPLMTINHFGGSIFQMGLIEVIWGSGALVGGLSIGLKQMKSVNKIVLINSMYLLLGVYLVISGLLPKDGYTFFAVWSIVGGIAYAIFNALFIATIQRHIDPSVLGRVFSVFFSLTMLPALIGVISSGFLAETLGIPTVFIIGGFIIGLVGVISLFIPSVIELGRD